MRTGGGRELKVLVVSNVIILDKAHLTEFIYFLP